MTKLPRAKTFALEFDTRSLPGKLQVWLVTLEREMIDVRDQRLQHREFRLDLKDHPDYPALVRYVLNNLPADADEG